MKTTRFAGTCWSAAAALGLLAGCSNNVSKWSVRFDPSPELQTMNDTHGQQWNKVFRSANTNIRGMQEDFYRVMMLDEPDPTGRIPIP